MFSKYQKTLSPEGKDNLDKIKWKDYKGKKDAVQIKEKEEKENKKRE